MDMSSDVFRSGVPVDRVMGLAEFLEHRNQRVFAVQDHAMVEIVVDPGLDDVFDVREVDYHAAMVGFFGLDVYFNAAVVARAGADIRLRNPTNGARSRSR